MMMDCGTFLDDYSDYRDGLLAPARQAAFDAHLRACESCARYDRVVDGGVRVFRSLPQLEVADDFMERLQHRLWHERDDLAAARARRARRSSRRVAAAAVAAAATVAAVALAPGFYARTAPTVTLLPSVAAATPAAAAAPSRIAQHEAGQGLAARLEQVGVQVYPMPYADVMYHSASSAALASYGGGVMRHSAAAE